MGVVSRPLKIITTNSITTNSIINSITTKSSWPAIESKGQPVARDKRRVVAVAAQRVSWWRVRRRGYCLLRNRGFPFMALGFEVLCKWLCYILCYCCVQ